MVSLIAVVLLATGCSWTGEQVVKEKNDSGQVRMPEEVQKATQGQATILGGWKIENGYFAMVVLDEEGVYYATMPDNSNEIGKWRLFDDQLLLTPDNDPDFSYEFTIQTLGADRAELILDGDSQVWLRNK